MQSTEIETVFQRVIDALDVALETVEKKTQEATQPALYDLRRACEYKGITVDSARKANHLQPLCGYYTHWEDTPQRRKPRWTRQQIEPWARVTRPQRIEYVEGLLYSEDVRISSGVLHMLVCDAEAGRLPDYLQEVIDEYVTGVKGAVVNNG